MNVNETIEQRNYFSFYNYEYYLDVTRQSKIYPKTISLEDGIKDAANGIWNIGQMLVKNLILNILIQIWWEDKPEFIELKL